MNMSWTCLLKSLKVLSLTVLFFRFRIFRCLLGQRRALVFRTQLLSLLRSPSTILGPSLDHPWMRRSWSLAPVLRQFSTPRVEGPQDPRESFTSPLCTVCVLCFSREECLCEWCCMEVVWSCAGTLQGCLHQAHWSQLPHLWGWKFANMEALGSTWNDHWYIVVFWIFESCLDLGEASMIIFGSPILATHIVCEAVKDGAWTSICISLASSSCIQLQSIQSFTKFCHQRSRT